MGVKKILDEAFQKGEKMKEELLVELVNSKLFSDLVKNEKFIQAISAVVRAKDEVGKVLQNRVKQILKFMDIPTRKDLNTMATKVARLEHELGRVGQRVRIESGKKTVAQKKSGRKASA